MLWKVAEQAVVFLALLVAAAGLLGLMIAFGECLSAMGL